MEAKFVLFDRARTQVDPQCSYSGFNYMLQLKKWALGGQFAAVLSSKQKGDSIIKEICIVAYVFAFAVKWGRKKLKYRSVRLMGSNQKSG